MSGLQSFYSRLFKASFVVLALFLLTAITPSQAQAHPSYFYAHISIGAPYLYTGYYGIFPRFGLYRSLRVPEIRTYTPTDVASLEAIAALGELKRRRLEQAQQEPQVLPEQPEPSRKELPLLPPEITTETKPEFSSAAMDAIKRLEF